MKKTVLRLAALMTILGPLTAQAAEPIYGVWVRDGHPDDKMEFYDCAGKLCARGIETLPDGSPAPEILRKAAKNGDNSWKGDLFNPEDGKTYTGSITYDSTNKLTLSGCLMIFCQSETWTRMSFASKPKPKATEEKPAAKDAKAEAKPESKPESKPEAKEAGKAHEAAGHATAGHGAAREGAAHEGAAKESAKEAAPHAAPAAAAAPKPKAPAAPKPKPAPAPADDQ